MGYLLKHCVASLSAGINNSRQGWLWLGFYCAVACLLFGAVALLLNQNQQQLMAMFLNYLFPPDWHNWAERLIDFLFASQTKLVLVSLMLNTALVVTSLLLFPLKEKCSQQFERVLRPNAEEQELPLYMQALEEGKLLLVYIAAQALVLAIGYYPYTWCKVLSSGFGLTLLFFTFGLDFIAPTLQRHGLRYQAIVRTLLRNWPVTLLFGALFSSPLLLFGRWILNHSDWSLIDIASVLFIANIVIVAWAIPAGTYLALQLQPKVEGLVPLPAKQRATAYTVLLTTLVLGVAFHSLVALSMHHKSQILKCEYALDWSSFNGDFSSFKNVLFGKDRTHLQFDLQVTNPTAFDLVLENSRLLVRQQGREVGEALITALEVPSQQTVATQVKLDAQINLGNVAGWGQMREGWQVLLEFDLLPGLPFMLQII